ncbi:hypothetical protein DACRYDRAFT_53435, partial [Dacryopinax primogenitus]
PTRATVIGIILSSDKTQLANFRSNSTAWPVYMSIANIHKDFRRKINNRAMVLLGYLPTAKLREIEHTTDRAIRLHDLFHHCMTHLLQELRTLGAEGIMMVCPDKKLRHIYPVVVSYIADHPEQCLVVGCRQNRCPLCLVNWKERSQPLVGAPRQMNVYSYFRETSESLREYYNRCSLAGMVAITQPFWEQLLHCDIFSSITPDILHELHKGLFGDHLRDWLAEVIGYGQLDHCYRSMLPHDNLIHFPQGIMYLDKITGTEYKNMEKTFCGAIGGLTPHHLQHPTRALIDMIYLSQLPLHTTSTLNKLQACWEEFHAHKEVFVEYFACKNFNFPKMHKPNHHISSIQSRGTLDNFSTELLEHLHISLAKDAYRAGN